MSARKVANELHWASGVRRSDQSVRNRFLQNASLSARRPLVVIHLTQRHRQTHVAWATPMSFVFMGILQCLERTNQAVSSQ
jgi:hypothetical protein